MDIGDIYLITGTDFDNGSINFKTSKYVSEFRYKQDKNIQLQNDDILITKDGTLGKVAIIRNLNKRATLNSGIYRIRINDITKVDPNYLYQYLSAPFLLNFANKTSIGGTIKHLNQSQIVNLPIPLSTLEEQKKISKFLFNLELKIKIVNGKINILKKYKEGIMKLCLSLSQNEGKTLKRLVSENELRIGRGTIIPRQEGIYPVYSSSAKNDGLFCYTNFYKYDEDLITWSIDGGGQPFYRKKHKFSITNVCGFIKIIDFAKWDYTWLYINIWNNWCRNKFDYTSKAHPSIIEEIYKIKPLSLDKQKKISMVFLAIEKHEKNLESKLNKLKEIKKYLLSNLFI